MMRSIFSAAMDPLVARSVFLREKLLPEGEFSSGILLVPAVRWSFRPCAAKHGPEVSPLGNDLSPHSEEGATFARYGPDAFGGLRSFMVDPSCLDQYFQEKILCLFRCGVNRNVKSETSS